MLPRKLLPRMYTLNARFKAGEEWYDDEDGLTPMHVAAAFSGGPEILRLSMHGFDINARDSGGRTPLHFAAWMGSTRAIPVLLAGGALLDAQDGGGRTPLHFASRYGAKEACLMLLRAGARSLNDDQGRNPLHQAMLENACHALALIYLNTKCDVNQWDKEGGSVIVAQALAGHWKCVGALAECGADPDRKDPRGHTASEVAKMQGRLDQRDLARHLFERYTERAHEEARQEALSRFNLERETYRDW